MPGSITFPLHKPTIMIIPQTYVVFDPPITLNLRLGGPRARVVPPGAAAALPPPVTRVFPRLPMHLHIDSAPAKISAYLMPIPGSILLYVPEDFRAACADTMDDHCARVLELLGDDPAAALQRLIDGGEPPAITGRVPRQIELWQAKAVLEMMGMLRRVELILPGLEEPQRTVVLAAWNGNARLERNGTTTMALAPALGLDAAQIDALFIQAAALVV